MCFTESPMLCVSQIFLCYMCHRISYAMCVTEYLKLCASQNLLWYVCHRISYAMCITESPMLCVAQNFLCCVSSDIRFFIQRWKTVYSSVHRAYKWCFFIHFKPLIVKQVFSFPQSVLRASMSLYRTWIVVLSIVWCRDEMGDDLRCNSVNLVVMMHVFHLIPWLFCSIVCIVLYSLTIVAVRWTSRQDYVKFNSLVCDRKVAHLPIKLIRNIIFYNFSAR